MKTRLPLLFLSLLAWPIAPATAATPAAAASAASVPTEVEELCLAADKKALGHDYLAAIQLYKRATKASGYRCAACQIGLAKAYSARGELKDAAKSAEAALPMTEEPALLAAAWNQLALAQFSLAGDDAAKLRLAETSFREALKLVPTPTIRFNLGVTLLRLGRDAEGLAELRAFIDSAPQTTQAKAARDILENPRRARESMLPSLDLQTLDGRRLTNADLAGKVVLIDFWGTWCAPCRASIPSLKALVERTRDQPLVVVSVSNDSDEKALKSFISEHSMTWAQVWDRSGNFGDEFKIRSYPTYLLVDHEGVIVFRYSGWSEHVEDSIRAYLRRALAKAKNAGETATAP
jgi:thiol-disulfide isomerase/thioredoxin